MTAFFARFGFSILFALNVVVSFSVHAQPMCAADHTTFDPSNAPHTEKLDIVWVIDNSKSMDSYRSKVADLLPIWAKSLVDMKIDFQIAVITSDGIIRSDLSGEHALNSQNLILKQDQFFRDFKKAIRVGIQGSHVERHFDSALDFLKENSSTFLQKDSNLIILFLSDLDSKDASRSSPKKFINTLLKYRDHNHLQLYGLLENQNRENFDTLNDEFFPIQILDLDPNNGGVFTKPEEGLADQMGELSKSMAAASPIKVEILLTLAPTEKKFEVSVNAVRTDPLTPLQYDEEKRSVSFSLKLADPSSIQIRYSADCASAMCGSDEKTVELTSIPHNGKLDILWVIDNSSSMETYQNAISKNLSEWVKNLAEQEIDFKIAVTTSDKKVNSKQKGKHALSAESLHRDREQFFHDFEKAVKVGLKGSWTEKFFGPSLHFLKKKSKNFLREGSDLAIIFVTDIDPHYDEIGPHEYIQSLLQYRDRDHLQLFGILAGNHPIFDVLKTEKPSMKIFEFSGDTRGVNSIAQQLISISKSMIDFPPMKVTIPLSKTPSASIFEVYVNGVLTESTIAPQYNASTNEVTVSLYLKERSVVKIKYPSNCDFSEGQKK